MIPGETTPLKAASTVTDGKFSSTSGVIASCLGCAIGTGNIWRFPRMLAQNSGNNGAFCFLLPWIMFLFVWSVPMLVIEYATGRYTGKGVAISMQILAGDKTVWCAFWIALVNFMIGCWYHVVMGWCIFYAYQVTFHPLPETLSESKDLFTHYIQETGWPVLTQAIGILLTGLIMLKGVRTIERSNIVMVPVLLILVVTVFIWSMTRDGAAKGLKFFFTPDWATLGKPRLWIDAASQNAFDCAAGWGQFIAYASFMTSREPIVKYAVFIPIGNNIISLVCGMMTFTTAFSSLPHGSNNTDQQHVIDILKTSGPASTGLTFIWLPVLFATAGTAGRVFSSLFFICLVVAAVSSLMGTIENVIQVLENYGLPRVYSVISVVAASFLVGLGSSLNIQFLSNQDFTWAFALLISGIFLQVMVVKFGISKFREHIINASGDWYVPKVWEWIIKYLAPFQAISLMLWWIVDTIATSSTGTVKWYAFGPQTLLPVLIQWAGWLLAMILINAILIYVRPTWFTRHSYVAESDLLRTELSTSVSSEESITDANKTSSSVDSSPTAEECPIPKELN